MKPKNMSPMEYVKQLDKALADENYQKYIQLISKQVRWLYCNSHKCTWVIDEKKVHYIQQKLQSKIKKIEKENIKLKKFITNGLKIGYVLNPNKDDTVIKIIEEILN